MQTTQEEIDILRDTLNRTVEERDKLSREVAMLYECNREQGVELVRLRAETSSRRGEIIEVTHRAGVAMGELNAIIKAAYQHMDRILEGWTTMALRAVVADDVRAEWLRQIDALRTAPPAEIAAQE